MLTNTQRPLNAKVQQDFTKTPGSFEKSQSNQRGTRRKQTKARKKRPHDAYRHDNHDA